MAASSNRADTGAAAPQEATTIIWQDPAETFSPPELIAQCAFDWAQHTRAKGLALVSHTGEFPRGKLMGRPRGLRAALDILLNNAVRFTGTGSVSLDCRAGPLEGTRIEVAFQVADTGDGFDPEQRHILFSEPGLTRLRDLVGGMGGEFDAESTPGRGTLTRISVPLQFEPYNNMAIDVGPSPSPAGLDGILSGRAHLVAADAVMLAATRQSALGDVGRIPASAPGARRARLLLVDDTLMNQTVISALLLRSGYRLDVVNSGPAALEATATEAYDLILMDLRMPGMDGIETSNRIRSRGGPAARIPIVALSADQDRETLAAVEAAGMNGYIAKPIDRSGLIEAVQKALDHKVTTAGQRDAI